MPSLLKTLATWGERLRKTVELAPHIDDLHAAFEDRGGGALSRHERELLENALAFSEVVADDVGVPRADIVAVHMESGFEQVLQAFKDSAHTRLPVVGRDLDDVKGLVLIKDVIGYVGRGEAFTLEKILRPATFVAESMTLPRVLQTMKKTRIPLVLVVDEFGGTSGLITLKDIVEELVGDIDDEHADTGPAPVIALAPGKWRVRGDLPLEDFDAQAGTNLAAETGEDVETVGGAVLRAAKTVPGRGETFALGPGISATVAAADGRRVLSVDIIIKNWGE